MIYNIIIWEECRHLDHKTYDDLPLREKISLSFVSQGISLEAPAGMHLHLQAMSTKHSMDRNIKAINHNDLDPWSTNINWEILVTVPSYLSYGTSKEIVFKYHVGIVSFCLIINKLMIDFGLCWDFKVRSVHKGFCHLQTNLKKYSKVIGNS